MKTSNIAALGLMTFSLFLGAGNLIFPPIIGYLAGDQTWQAGAGFILGDVGLTLLALIAVALSGGPDKVVRDFSPAIQKLFWVVLFIVIGPAFVIPRAVMVAYETGFMPFFPNTGDTVFHGYVVVYLAITLALTLKPGQLVSTIGKWMTPLLALMLTTIAVGTLINPQSAIEPARGVYESQPVAEGLIQGYLTMDVLGALGFGWIITHAIKSLGVTSGRDIARFTTMAGLIAAIGMILIYSALFYLGATSHGLVPDASNGARILSTYVAALFGPAGNMVLTLVITLACLTTCIGVTGASAEYFSKTFTSFSYRQYVTAIAVASALVATVGLDQLIVLTVPVIVTIYPVAIAVIIMPFIRRFLFYPTMVTRVVSATALLFAIPDGIKATGFMPESINAFLTQHLPMFEQGMGWVVPGMIMLVLSIAASQCFGWNRQSEEAAY